MPKDFRMDVETGHYKTTGNDVQLRHSATVKAVKNNWILLSLYFIITIVGVVLSYFTSGWCSVFVSAPVALITFLIGYWMLQQVITITNEVR
jgi:hypothetical protein